MILYIFFPLSLVILPLCWQNIGWTLIKHVGYASVETSLFLCKGLFQIFFLCKINSILLLAGAAVNSPKLLTDSWLVVPKQLKYIINKLLNFLQRLNGKIHTKFLVKCQKCYFDWRICSQTPKYFAKTFHNSRTKDIRSWKLYQKPNINKRISDAMLVIFEFIF